MLHLSPQATIEALEFPPLIEALRQMFKSGCEMPVRHHHQMEVPGEPEATMLLMPAWLPGKYAGVKIVNVMPGNSARGLPAVSAEYLLSDARTGEMLAMIDGGELTARRTAAASALASQCLSRPNSKHLVVAGTGRVCANLISAHSAVRPIDKITIWGRSVDKAAALARQVMDELGVDASVANDLESAVRTADIVSAATLSIDPLILGDWLPAGCHVDLVGAFRPDMRESDDEAIRRARVYVDTRAGCTKEGGDIVQPLASGVLQETDIVGDLYDLCHGSGQGRQTVEDITLFKSVGAALEDLAGAILAYETSQSRA